jgi:hypothetical protein
VSVVAAGVESRATGAGGAVGACVDGAELGASSSPSLLLSFEDRLLRLPDMPGAVTWMHDSDPQFRGASICTRCPLTWKEIPLPAWAAVLAINSAAAKQYVLMEASVSELVISPTILWLTRISFRDLCHVSGREAVQRG